MWKIENRPDISNLAVSDAKNNLVAVIMAQDATRALQDARLVSLAPEMKRVLDLALEEFENLLNSPHNVRNESKPYVERIIRTLKAVQGDVEGLGSESKAKREIELPENTDDGGPAWTR